MYTTTAHRIIRAPRSAVYRALLDPDAVGRWRVPDGMSAEVHEFEPREGGRFRVSLTYDGPDGVGKTTERSDTYAGTFTRIEPYIRLVERLHFETEDPDLAAEMTMTTRLADTPGGCLVEMVHQGVPDAVPAEDNATGMRMALARLARLVEGHADRRAGEHPAGS